MALTLTGSFAAGGLAFFTELSLGQVQLCSCERAIAHRPRQWLSEVGFLADPPEAIAFKCSSICRFQGAIDTEDSLQVCSSRLGAKANFDSGARNVAINSNAGESVLLMPRWAEHPLDISGAINGCNGTKLVVESLQKQSQ